MNIFKKLYISFWLLLLVIIALAVWANFRIESSTAPYIKSNVNDLPSCNAALLLGTSKMQYFHKPNPYFYNRIAAAAELYQAKKIKYFIVSGDHSDHYYNEPADMKKELLKAGIPASIIFLDYAGLRTFDSVVRARNIFGQNAFIVVSQEFQNQRAVYIARHYGMEAYGYNAKDVAVYDGLKTKIREFFARLKVFIDIYLGNLGFSN